MTAVTIYDPFKDLFGRRSLLPAFFKTFEGEEEATERLLAPRVDVTENEREYTIMAELPGFEIKDTKLEVHEGTLRLIAERNTEREEKKDSYHIRERSYGTFTRAFRLPEDVDAEKIEARMKNGLLTVVLAKREETKPKKIEVKIN